MRQYCKITVGGSHTQLRICDFNVKITEGGVPTLKKNLHKRSAEAFFSGRVPAESVFREVSHIRYFRARFPAGSVFQDLPHIRYFHAKFPPEVYFVAIRIFAIFRQSSACSILREVPHIRHFTPSFRLRFYRNFIMCRFSQFFVIFFLIIFTWHAICYISSVKI